MFTIENAGKLRSARPIDFQICENATPNFFSIFGTSVRGYTFLEILVRAQIPVVRPGPKCRIKILKQVDVCVRTSYGRKWILSMLYLVCMFSFFLNFFSKMEKSGNREVSKRY